MFAAASTGSAGSPRSHRLVARMRLLAAATAAVALQAGCGGGGTSPATPQSEASQGWFDRSNYVGYAEPAGHALLVASDLLSILRSYALPSVAGQASDFPPQDPPRVETQNFNANCQWPGLDTPRYQGSLAGTFADHDGDGRPSAADVLTLTFTDCAWQADLPPVNGTVRITFTRADYSPAHLPERIEAAVEFERLSLEEDVLVNGPARIELSTSEAQATLARLELRSTAMRLSGDELVANVTVSQALAPTAFRLQTTGQIALNGQALTIEQPRPLAGSYETSLTEGEIRVWDPAGNALSFQAAADGRLGVRLIPAGQTDVATSIEARRWIQFRRRNLAAEDNQPATLYGGALPSSSSGASSGALGLILTSDFGTPVLTIVASAPPEPEPVSAGAAE